MLVTASILGTAQKFDGKKEVMARFAEQVTN